MTSRSAWIGMAIIAVGIVVLVALDLAGGIGDVPNAAIASLVAATALLVWVGAGVLGHYRGRSGSALGHVAIWLAIGLVIALAYTYGGFGR